MATYRISGGRLTATARSSVHDTRAVWTGLTGQAELDPAALAAARLELAVDMTGLDAGDFLKNRKLRKDLDVERHPTARFVLAGLDEVRADGDGFVARARGTLRYRDREVAVVAAGRGTLQGDGFTARAGFDLDVRAVGVTPPRFLMFKVEDVVRVEIELLGRRT